VALDFQASVASEIAERRKAMAAVAAQASLHGSHFAQTAFSAL
jgi:hypothetical protein